MLFEVYRCVQLNRWSVACGCVSHRGQRGEAWRTSPTLCRHDTRMGLSCLPREGESGRVDPGGVLMYESAMAASQEVCLYYASVYLC